MDAVSPYRAVRERMFNHFPDQEAKRALAEGRRAVERSGVIIITWLRHTVTSPMQARESEADFELSLMQTTQVRRENALSPSLHHRNRQY